MKKVTGYLKLLFFTFEGQCDCKIGELEGRKGRIYAKPAKNASPIIYHCRQHRKHTIDGVWKQLAVNWNGIESQTHLCEQHPHQGGEPPGGPGQQASGQRSRRPFGVATGDPGRVGQAMPQMPSQTHLCDPSNRRPACHPQLTLHLINHFN